MHYLRTANELAQSDKAQEALIPVDLVFEDYPRIDLTEDEYIRFKNGAILTKHEFPQIVAPTACYFEELISIYGPHPTKKAYQNQLKCFRKGEKNAND